MAAKDPTDSLLSLPWTPLAQEAFGWGEPATS